LKIEDLPHEVKGTRSNIIWSFRRGDCSNRQNAVIGGEEVWLDRHITSSGWKSLIYSSSCLFTVYMGVV